MLGVTLIVLGKLKEKYLSDACSEYVKRLKTLCRLTIAELPAKKLSDNPSDAEIAKCLESEAEEIIQKIPNGAKKIAMCIEGKQMSSEKLSDYFSSVAVSGCGNIAIIIGSSYGLSDKIKNMSDLKLSMSEMTFPHQLARVMILEQIYRAFMISTGSKYHI